MLSRRSLLKKLGESEFNKLRCRNPKLFDDVYPSTRGDEARKKMESILSQRPISMRDGNLLSEFNRNRRNDSAWFKKMRMLYPETTRSKGERAFTSMLEAMPKTCTFAPGQKWKGNQVTYIFIDEILGKFKKLPGHARRAWNKGLSGHPDSGRKHAEFAKLKRVRNLETGQVFVGLQQAAIACGYSKTNGSNIGECCNGKRKTACGGFQWAYVD